MPLVQEFAGYFLAMLVLAGASAFFSCSEAVLFSLQPETRRAMRRGHAGQRVALDLLSRPERLLTSILFWNLAVNTLYFAVASVVGIKLKADQRAAEAGAVGAVAVLSLILVGEMAPKILGVRQPSALAGVISIPLLAAVRLLDPVLPAFAAANRLLRRVLAPRFAAEPYLELVDLERAIALSTSDAQLAAKEQSALQNIVLLSDLTAEELMRPRPQYEAVHPPVNLEDLNSKLPAGGYMLVTEPDSDEIAAAIPFRHLSALTRNHLEQFARAVVYVPWCTTAAAVLEELRHREREVAAVINEFGETVGIITLEDLLETIFEDQSSRSTRLLAKSSMSPLGDDSWEVTGITTLRRIGRHFHVPLEQSASVTVAGILQEILQRIPEPGDECTWSGFHFHVLEASPDDPMRVVLRRLSAEGERA